MHCYLCNKKRTRTSDTSNTQIWCRRCWKCGIKISLAIITCAHACVEVDADFWNSDAHDENSNGQNSADEHQNSVMSDPAVLFTSAK